MGGKGGQTIGYHYLFDILFGLCRGPVNELVEIKVGEKTAWTGSLSTDAINSIQKPNLFGGQEKEGGIQGPFRLFPGRHDQVLPDEAQIDCGSGPYGGNRKLPNVKTAIGGLVSEMRGTTRLWFSGLISSMNPYPKEWKFRLRRYNAGWYNDEPWYPNMARVLMESGAIHAMNPAHIIYQCLTDPSWGRGFDPALIDENSFILAANALCAEGFGLCFFWQRRDDLDQFVLSVREHIAAELYPDPETGKMTLKLLRDDYDPEELPLFTPQTGLIEIMDDDAASQDEAFSEVIGKGLDPITNKEFQIRVHSLAARQSQGTSIPQFVDYPGVPTRDLMARVLQRDLRLHASGLKRFRVALDRRGWRIRPGMCFRISDAKRGISNMVLRAVEIKDNASRKSRIEIRTLEDVYGMPATAFVTPTPPSWTPPPTDALPTADARMIEANYRDLRLRLPAAAIDEISESGVIGTVALAPHVLMQEYDLATKATGDADFVVRASGAFTGAATLVDAIGPYDTIFEITGETDITEDLVGQAILCGDEHMGVTAYDSTTHMLTVKRGVADTVPASHAPATEIWTIDDDAVSDLREYAPAETVEAKILTKASGDILDPADAPTLSIEVVARWIMPYPPGNVLVGGVPALEGLPPNPEPELTWVHRDRILQEEQLIGHPEGSVGPEAGTTYNIRIYDEAAPLGPPIRTEAAIAGTSYVYLEADQITDGSPNGVWFELESERDGLTSYQLYRFYVQLKSSYGYGYGQAYGGTL